MMTFQDYADRAGVSRQAISRQVNNHREEFGDHIIVQNRTQYLDDVAVKLLDEMRAASPVIVENEAKQDEVETLREERDNLKNQLILVQQQMIQQIEDSNKKIMQLTSGHTDREEELQNRIISLEAERARNEEISGERDSLREELVAANQRNMELEIELARNKERMALLEEAAKSKKGFFARLFGK